MTDGARQSYRDLIEATQESPPDRETMIAELGRRHPAAADDVDAILAMPRSDAVNEGLLACPLCRSDKIALGKRYSEDNGNEPAVRCMECGCQATLKAWNTRAVHSPGTVGVRAALEPFAKIAEFVIETQRDSRPIIFGMDNVILQRLTIGDLRRAKAAFALTPSHCMAGRIDRETAIIMLARKFPETFTPYGNGKGANALAGNVIDAILALTSEQSGPTAGREKGGSVCCYCDARLSCAQCGMEQPDDTTGQPK